MTRRRRTGFAKMMHDSQKAAQKREKRYRRQARATKKAAREHREQQQRKHKRQSRATQKAERKYWEQQERERKRQIHQRYIDALIATEEVRRLTPSQFERYVGMLFKGFGCEVEQTGQANDKGVDLIVYKNGRRGIVQCKQYAPGHKVGSPTIRDLRGAMVREGVTLGFLVTTSSFTRQAIEEATYYTPKVTLLDVEKLNQLAEESAARVDSSEARLNQPVVNRPPPPPPTPPPLPAPQPRQSTARDIGEVIAFMGISTIVLVVGFMALLLVCCILAAITDPETLSLLFYV